MFKQLPTFGTKLNKDHIAFVEAFAQSCRHSILAMTTNAKSGHPGGSLGMIDYLSLLYAFRLGQTGEPLVVSNGHVSPAVYAVLAEMGYIPKDDVVNNFRKAGSIYEGHVTRHVSGVWYGTGPLGCGVSAGSGFALAEKLNVLTRTPPQPSPTRGGSRGSALTRTIFATVGDGEAQEGQVYEMMNFSAKYKLDNFVVFMDYNGVQLTDGLKNIMPYDPKKIFESGGWHVIDVNGHNYQAMWKALSLATKIKNKPVLLFGQTEMGKGVDFMEREGRRKHATWHGKAAKPEEAEKALERLKVTNIQQAMLNAFRKEFVLWKPKQRIPTGHPSTRATNNKQQARVTIGKPRLYKADELTDCRTAYGKALLDLAELNKHVVALTADVAGSVKTSYVKEVFPGQHIECGIAEQQMVSCAGGLSLSGMVPFASTFGAFMTSRAKDQARVNDINDANVKMVATHCGLSVGEDGPTHQAIDDMGSMLGLFNTRVIEPADPNQCDRIIRYVASEYGNFYVRMGRHKIPVLTKENGDVFFDKKYKYYYGRCDVLRKGSDVTIVATGATVIEALRAWEILKEQKISAEIVIVSSIKKFDKPLFNSIKKTKRVVTVEDHNTLSGLGGQLGRSLVGSGYQLAAFKMLGVEGYQLSGTAAELYKTARIDAGEIVKVATRMM